MGDNETLRPRVNCVIVDVEAPFPSPGPRPPGNIPSFEQAIFAGGNEWRSSLRKPKGDESRSRGPALKLAGSIAGAIRSVLVEEFGSESYPPYSMANARRSLIRVDDELVEDIDIGAYADALKSLLV